MATKRIKHECFECGGSGETCCDCGGHDDDCAGCGGTGRVTCYCCGGSGFEVEDMDVDDDFEGDDSWEVVDEDDDDY